MSEAASCLFVCLFDCLSVCLFVRPIVLPLSFSLCSALFALLTSGSFLIFQSRLQTQTQIPTESLKSHCFFAANRRITAKIRSSDHFQVATAITCSAFLNSPWESESAAGFQLATKHYTGKMCGTLSDRESSSRGDGGNLFASSVFVASVVNEVDEADLIGCLLDCFLSLSLLYACHYFICHRDGKKRKPLS